MLPKCRTKRANFLRFREEVSLEGISSHTPMIGNMYGGTDPFRVSCPGKPKLEMMVMYGLYIK